MAVNGNPPQISAAVAHAVEVYALDRLTSMLLTGEALLVAAGIGAVKAVCWKCDLAVTQPGLHSSWAGTIAYIPRLEGS
jgi:hypothetical protein